MKNWLMLLAVLLVPACNLSDEGLDTAVQEFLDDCDDEMRTDEGHDVCVWGKTEPATVAPTDPENLTALAAQDQQLADATATTFQCDAGVPGDSVDVRMSWPHDGDAAPMYAPCQFDAKAGVTQVTNVVQTFDPFSGQIELEFTVGGSSTVILVETATTMQCGNDAPTNLVVVGDTVTMSVTLSQRPPPLQIFLQGDARTGIPVWADLETQVGVGSEGFQPKVEKFPGNLHGGMDQTETVTNEVTAIAPTQTRPECRTKYIEGILLTDMQTIDVNGYEYVIKEGIQIVKHGSGAPTPEPEEPLPDEIAAIGAGLEHVAEGAIDGLGALLAATEEGIKAIAPANVAQELLDLQAQFCRGVAAFNNSTSGTQVTTLLALNSNGIVKWDLVGTDAGEPETTFSFYSTATVYRDGICVGKPAVFPNGAVAFWTPSDGSLAEDPALQVDASLIDANAFLLDGSCSPDGRYVVLLVENQGVSPIRDQLWVFDRDKGSMELVGDCGESGCVSVHMGEGGYALVSRPHFEPAVLLFDAVGRRHVATIADVTNFSADYRLKGGSVEVVTTDTATDRWRVTLVDPADGSFAADQVIDLDAACRNPRHVIWLEDGRAAISCRDTGNVALLNPPAGP